MSKSFWAKLPISIFIVLSSWRILLAVIQIFGRNLFPLQHKFLFGGYWEYIKNPTIFAWANFDGDRYINIATNGYTAGSYSFFPLYPKFISLFVNITST